MFYFRFLLLALFFLTGTAFISESAPVYMAKRDSKFALVPLCDGFDFPVGKPDGKGYYRSRGLRLKSPRHMGEDWNGNGGDCWLRILEFKPDGKTISVSTFSPLFAISKRTAHMAWRNEACDRFDITVARP